MAAGKFPILAGTLNISIRPFREEDQQSVLDLWDKVFPGAPPHNNPVRDLRTRSEIQPELFLVALQEGEIVGTVMAGCEGQQGWVYYLGVDPDHRRRGIGSRLMKRVEATLVGLGCKELHFQIWASKAEVQAFYERLGYIAEGQQGMWREF
ncbi:MAG: GNAT family acetyltransferase [Anaerolineales bacterium]